MERPQHSLRAGTIIDARYRVNNLVAHSDEVHTYAATHLDLSRNVTLKLLVSDSDRDRKFFCRGARVQSMLRHPNVVHVYDMGKHEAQPYLVLEYLDGQSLDARCRMRGLLGISEFENISTQLLEGLDYIHSRNVVHRDLAAHNVVLIDDLQRGDCVKITQFTASKELSSKTTSLVDPAELAGSLTHVSPEQILSSDDPTKEGDIYAAGSLIYRLATGRPHVNAATLSELADAILAGSPLSPKEHREELTKRTSDAILRALSHEPSNRFGSAAEFLEQLGFA